MMLRGVFHVNGVWLSTDPIVGIEALGMDPNRVTNERIWTDGAGNRYLEFEIRPTVNRDWLNLVRVDVTRDFLPVRLEKRLRGQTRALVTVRHVEDPDIGWRVATWTDSRLNSDSRSDTTLHHTVERFQVNPRIADDTFELVFPEGTHVHEVVGEDADGSLYVAGTGGVLKPISAAEYGSSAEPKPRGR
jgi:hypothetical protein